MSEMIDRVAAALFMAGTTPPFTAADFANMPERSKDIWRRDASLAIEAMREPTEAMIAAARTEMMMDPVRSANVFQVMIDAALKV